MWKLILALIALCLFGLPSHAQLVTRDGKDRTVQICNQSQLIVALLYAVPAATRWPIYGPDLLPSKVIMPGQCATVLFDNGYGECVFDIRAVSDIPNVDWISRYFNVCTRGNWNLGN